MSAQQNGPGCHLSLAKDDWMPPRLSASDRRFQARDSAGLAAWIAAHWVPCAGCGNKHPPRHGSHCIVCAAHTPETEQRSHIAIGPRS